jgi:alkylation response protein AidB-like acyl-CoA dehydrogenase
LPGQSFRGSSAGAEDADTIAGAEALRSKLCATVAALVPQMQARASILDEHDRFPVQDLQSLRAAGAFVAPFPASVGGLDMGSLPPGASAISDMLRHLGRGNLSVGRLFEAHVNAVRLLARYGSPSLLSRAVQDATAGSLFGLWVTDGPGNPLRVTPDGLLMGGKAVCSGAGHVGHAVVTVERPDGGTYLAYLSTRATAVERLGKRMQGMRAAATGRVSFESAHMNEPDWMGGPGDYLREPDFSTGAWRSSAVACGGLESLVELAMRHLVARGRAGDPHQLARAGDIWIAQETALLWLSRAVSAAESPDAITCTDRVATVNFARIAIERACLDAMTAIERSLGLAAFLHPDPIERIRRDLGTYLRQPAPDEALTEAAAHILRSRMGGP